MELCKHQLHKVIDDIWEPKYSTGEVLIHVRKVPDKIEHFLVKFTRAPAYPSWLYFSGKDIRKSRRQKNGNGEVYVVSMAKAQDFKPKEHCEHEI